MATQPNLMSSAIVLFAKAPIAGNVKTRLQPPLSANEASELHLAFVLDFWERLQKITNASIYLFCDQPWPQRNEPASRERYGLQSGGDLGERMLYCFQEILGRGHKRALIVGSDSPTLPLSYLEAGLEKLRYSDAVLGPSDDGGYYAIGCCQVKPRMFEKIHWSSVRTREETDRAFVREGIQRELLPEWYDIDTTEGLRRLTAELDLLPEKILPRTRAWFEYQRASKVSM